MCCKELKVILGGDQECYSVSTVASEKGKEFRLNLSAGKTACKVRIDGCLISDAAIAKCDYIIMVCPDNRIFLIELKGTDVDRAVEQILKTFDYVKWRIKEYEKNKLSGGEKLVKQPAIAGGHIVSSAIPREAELKFRGLKERALKNSGLIISKHTSKFQLTI